MAVRDKFRKRRFGQFGWYGGDNSTEIPNTPAARAENSQTINKSVLDKSHKMGRRPPRGLNSRLTRARKQPTSAAYSSKYKRPKSSVSGGLIASKNRKGIL